MKELKKTGITRKIDVLGRIVVPIEIRKGFNVETGGRVEFFIDSKSKGIVLQKYTGKGMGLVRKLDDVGRVVIPIETRKSLDWNLRDYVEFLIDNKKGTIVLRKHLPTNDETGLGKMYVVNYRGDNKPKSIIYPSASLAIDAVKKSINERVAELYDLTAETLVCNGFFTFTTTKDQVTVEIAVADVVKPKEIYAS